jgi:hypothetical protein
MDNRTHSLSELVEIVDRRPLDPTHFPAIVSSRSTLLRMQRPASKHPLARSTEEALAGDSTPWRNSEVRRGALIEPVPWSFMMLSEVSMK